MLVGPSGGGKTTALKMVNRLIPFDSGEIRIDGRSIAELPLTELRRGIGYVIQQVGLFPHMTVGGEHRHRAAAARLVKKRRTPTAARSCSTLVGLEASDGRSDTRRSFRAASASASGSRARSPPTRRCC